jgi:hypothetical protein
MNTVFWLEDLKGRDHSKALAVGKGKVVPEGVLGSGGIAPRII